MKQLTALTLLVILISPQLVFSAYGLTQSADLETSSSQYFSRADTASLSITGDYTVECWINFESLPGSGVVYPILMKNDAGTNRSTNFLAQGNGSGEVILTWGVDETGNNSDISNLDYNWTTGIGVSTATWYHVRGTFDASAATVETFIDGSSVGSNTGTANAIHDGNAATYIGFQGGTSRYFDGKISLCRVWSEVHTTDDSCSVLGSTTNLAAEWTLDNTVTDNSGNSNTLTNNNSVPFVSDVPSECATTEEAPQSQWF